MNYPNPRNLRLSTTPVKSPSPDLHSANRITSTRNVKNSDYLGPSENSHSYVYRESTTPNKIFQTPKNQNTTSLKYFSNNRSSNIFSKAPQQTSHKTYNKTMRSDLSHPHHSFCHEAGHQINSELKKLLSMISSSGIVSQFHHGQYSPDKQKIQYQVSCIEKENKKLISLLQDLQQRAAVPTPCAHAQKTVELEHEVSILRSQLAKSTQKCDKEYQSLYQANTSLTTELYDLRDRNAFLEREGDSLRLLLKQKEDEFYRLQQEAKKKNQDKLSLSKIKDQYNQQIKVLKTNISNDLQFQASESEHKLKELSRKVSNLEERLRIAERKVQGTDQTKQLNYFKSQLSILESNLNDKDKEIRRLRDERSSFESQILFLKNKLKDSSSQIDREVESKVRVLLEGYERDMNLLKRDFQSLKIQKENLEKENERLRSQIAYLQKAKEQQLQSLRSEIYTLKLSSNMKSDLQYLERQNDKLSRQINYLKSRIAELQANEAELNNQLRIIKTSSYSTVDYTALKKKNDELSYDLSQKLIQITNLSSENEQLFNEHEELSRRLEEIGVAYERLKKDIGNQEEGNEMLIQEKNRKIHELQTTIHSITGMLEEMESKLRALEDSKSRLSLQAQSNEKMRARIAALETELRNLQINHESEISRLRVTIYNEAKNELNRDLEKDLAMRILQQRSEYSETIKEELVQLKALVDEGKFDKLEKQLVRMSELYSRELVNSEKDKQEIQKLLRMKIENDNKRAELEKLNIALEEKAKILQSNNKLVQKQLKERKQMYEQLMSQKCILEKQLASMKRSSIDSDIVKATRLRAMQISKKIDRLLTMEEEMGRSVLKYTTSYITVPESEMKKSKK